MKNRFLKIAKVKDEASFYKKYPSEQAFFKAHPEAKKLIKKAQSGIAIPGMEKPISLIPYITNAEKDARAQAIQQAQQPKEKSGGGGMDVGQMMQMAQMFAEYGAHIPKAQGGISSPFTGSGGNVFTPTGDFQSSWGNGQMQQPTVQLPQYPEQTAIDYNYQNQGTPEHDYNTIPIKPEKTPFDAMPIIGGIAKGISALKAEKKAKQRAEQDSKVTGVQAKAAESRDVDTPNVLARNINKQRDAMFQPIQPDQLFPTYGVGTNVLAAKNGTEIQNTFAPNTIYTDAAYEPLNDSNIKQYQFGGSAGAGAGSGGAGGFGQMMGGSGGFLDMAAPYAGSAGSAIGGGDFQENGGAQLGGGIGEGVGSAFGPAGGKIGKAAGSFIGGILDTNPKKIKAFQEQTKGNQNRINASAFSKNLQAENAAYMEHGGNLTNPQLITKFGEYDVKDLFRPDPTMDTLRVGGNLRSFTPPTEHGLQEYAMGGDLKTHWGGHAETMSQNPYLPASGETVMFKGQSHDESDNNGRTGIGITYGDSPVEVERGEPAVKLENGGEENLTVFGNLQIPKTHLDAIGDPNAKNKKFKTYVADLSNKEAKQNKIITKSSEAIDNHNVITPIDQLTFNSHKAMLQGADSKLKKYAEYKQNAAALQNAINDTAEEYGILADDLAKEGKFTIDKKAMKEQAKYGKELLKAQFGTPIGPAGLPNPSDNSQLVVPDYMENLRQDFGPIQSFQLSPKDKEWVHTWKGNKTGLGKKTASPFSEEEVNKKLFELGFKPDLNSKLDVTAQAAQFVHDKFPNEVEQRHQSLYGKPYSKDVKTNSLFGQDYIPILMSKTTQPVSTKPNTPIGKVEELPEVVVSSNRAKTPDVVPRKRNTFLDIASQIAPYLTPTFKNPLDANQLLGENYALGRNQIDPVQAQLYHPELISPYDISLQDQLNEATASSNAARRMSQGNPAAQAAIAAQESMGKSKILGEQFRMNQAQKAGVYNQNRQTLNDAQLKNLGILDQQYTRQSQAKSNAQALTQSALNSISDKVAKNKLETIGYNVYANQFPGYTFTSEGKLIKNPSFQQFEIPTVGSTTSGKTKQTAPEGFDYTYDKDGNVEGMKKIKKSGKNGAIVKAFKLQ